MNRGYAIKEHLSRFFNSINKTENMNIRHIRYYYFKIRLMLWRILDAIDRKLGPGPGDHRL